MQLFICFYLFFFFFLLNIFGTYKAFIIPHKYQIILEMIYTFIFDLLKDQATLRGQFFFPILFVTFGFILFSNFLGLMPYAFTSTSHIVITFSLAFSFFIGLTIVGFLKQGIKFLNLFIPSGVPIALLPLIVLIEIMSYFIRPISLSVRLFANMLAGHTLLHIVAGFGVSLFKKNFLFGLIPFIFLLAVSFLEFGIAFLQAYVFVILLAIYLNDSLNAAH